MSQAAILSALGSTGVSSGFKNRVINGVFDVWQRGTSRTFLGSGQYLADRWGCAGYQNTAAQRVAISSAPVGLWSSYALRSSSSTTSEAAGGTRMSIDHKIESINCADLAGQTITVSFWIKFSASTLSSVSNSGGGGNSSYGDFQSRVQYNTTSTDSAIYSDTGDGSCTTTAITGPTGSYNGGASFDITNGSFPITWTKCSYTCTVPSGVKNLMPRFTMTNLGSTASADTNYFDIAQVQLEVGTTPTEFERRSYGVELFMCQRYFQKTFPQATAPAQNTGLNGSCLVWNSSGSNNAYGTQVQWRLPVPMRTTPTVTYYNPAAANALARNSAIAADMTVYTSPVNPNGDSAIQMTIGDTASGPGHCCEIHVTVSAEL